MTAPLAFLLIAALACADTQGAELPGAGPPDPRTPGAESAEAETTGPRSPEGSRFHDALRTFAADGAYLITFPRRITTRGAWTTAGVLAGTALLVGRDDEIRDHVLGHESGTADDLAGLFEPLGTYLVAGAGLGAAYLSGRAADSERLVTTSAVAFEAWTWTAIITAASKGLFGRQPPAAGFDEDDFFDGGTIFPSGHTSRSFAIAAVFADRYGRPAAWIGYPAAALVGLSTVEQDTHWASDVLAGAALGLAIGKGIAMRHRPPGRPDEATIGAFVTTARLRRSAAWSLAPAPDGFALTIIF